MKKFLLRKPSFAKPSQETMEALTGILIQLIGESVKGRLLRAALVGAVSAGTYYVQQPADAPPTPPAVIAPAPTTGK